MKKFNIFGDAGASSTSKSVIFTGLNFEMEVGKDGHKCKPRESKLYNNRYVRISMLVVFEIIFYIITRRPIYDNWYISLLSLTLFLLLLFTYNYIFSDSKNLRMNHGAEHKVINAFLSHDLENVNKYSRFSDDCGSNIYPILVILISVSPVIKFPVTIFLIYTIIYNNLKPVRMMSFNTIGIFIQRFTTAEPTEEILKNTKDGFKELLYAETEKMIKDIFKSKDGKLKTVYVLKIAL